MEQEFNKYKWNGKKGFDDLKDINPYYGEWGYFSPAFEDVTEESYKNDVEGYQARVERWNTDYIENLKQQGKYGEVYTIPFNMKKTDLFDEPSPSNAFLQSGLLIPLGLTKHGEPQVKFNVEYKNPVPTKYQECEKMIKWYSDQLLKGGRDREDQYGWRWKTDEIIQLMIMYANKRLDESNQSPRS